MGIGQGAVNVNALQLCVMCSRIANGAARRSTRGWSRSIGGVEQPPPAAVPPLPIDKEHMDFLHDAMLAVTTDGTAAGRAANLNLGPIRWPARPARRRRTATAAVAARTARPAPGTARPRLVHRLRAGGRPALRDGGADRARRLRRRGLRAEGARDHARRAAEGPGGARPHRAAAAAARRRAAGPGAAARRRSQLDSRRHDRRRPHPSRRAPAADRPPRRDRLDLLRGDLP